MPLPSDNVGYLQVPMLNFLWGQPLNGLAISVISGLKPCEIHKQDHKDLSEIPAKLSQVTIGVDDNNLIRSIHQTLEVKLPHGVEHGHDLSMALLDHGIFIAALVDVEVLDGIEAELLEEEGDLDGIGHEYNDDYRGADGSNDIPKLTDEEAGMLDSHSRASLAAEHGSSID